jgi:hypothetical protein
MALIALPGFLPHVEPFCLHAFGPVAHATIPWSAQVEALVTPVPIRFAAVSVTAVL